jgi:hypothetical protein
LRLPNWGHGAPTLPASPRPRRVRHARAPPVPRPAPCLRLMSASTEARLARPPARAGCQTAPRWPSCWCAQRTPCWPAVAARTVASASAARPRASPRRRQPERSARPDLDAGARRQYSASRPRREPGKQRARGRPSSPALGSGPTPAGEDAQGGALAVATRRWQRKQPHGQSAAAPVLTAVSPGGRMGEARRSRCLRALPSRRGAGTWPGSL